MNPSCCCCSLQLLAVGIEEPKTLVGLINQVFDKALFEPHFCELYSQLCHVLQRQLPEFNDPGRKGWREA